MKSLLAIGIFFILLVPSISFAQIADLSQDMTIKTAPAFPGANTETTISLDAYTLDTSGASIKWYVDGQEETDARNDRSFKLTTKNIGDSTTVRIVLVLRAGQTLSKSITIKPTRVDTVIEANTIVPAFYQGRALPSVGSKVRIIATPYTGNDISPEGFTYTWKHDNKVLFGGPIKGGYIAEIEMGLGREQIITVDVSNSLGQTIARKSIVVPLTKPEVLFYEESPLRGASKRAISDPYILVGDEITVRAEPFYMAKDIFEQDHLIEWEINNRKVNNPSSDEQYLSLQRDMSNGNTKIGFHIRNLNQLLQGIKSDFTIQF